jgi:ParB family chromosome partitioning protein
MTTNTPTLELVDLDPNKLILPLDGNVRKDTQLDKQFLASIKNRGVLIPILVTPNLDGGHDVLDGQRRTLGAIEAGQETIPAIVTSSREPIDRVVDQLIVNDHRAALSDVEHAGAFQQLSLFGLAATSISKRTSTPIARVGDAIKVAGNEVASKALAEYDIDLTQAVVIADFSDDKAAVKKLTEAAEKNPGQFNHIAASELKKRELRDLKVALRAEIEAGEFPRVADVPEYQAPEGGYVSIEKLARPETPTVPLTVDDIRGVDGAASSLVTGWMSTPTSYQESAKIGYWVQEPESHGFVKLEREAYRAPERIYTPEELAAEEERRAAQQVRAERRAAWELAATVRATFISELVERPTLPADSITYIAWALTYTGEWYYGTPETKVLDWLDISYDKNDDTATAVRTALSARPKLAMAFTLASALKTLEDWTTSHRPGDKDDTDELPIVIFHLQQLRAWGYGLSELEQTIVDAAANVITEPDADDE